MNLDKKIDYSIALLRKAESMSLRLDPEMGSIWLSPVERIVKPFTTSRKWPV